MPWSKDNLPPSVKGKKWSDAQIAIFVKTANAILEKTGNEGEAIATGIKQAEASHENRNGVSRKPEIFYARHFQAGLCGYGAETVLVDTDAIKRMLPSGVGVPVYVHHQNVDLEALKEQASGYVTDSFYNELDGWGWFKILIVDDEAHEAIAKGWAVSNAYIPTQFGANGTKNNCPYTREILDGAFTHLAIVPDPRYEDAKIFSPDEFKAYQEDKRRQLDEMRNSKQQKGTFMFNIFKTKREAVAAADKDAMVEFTNDAGETQTISIGEMINACKKNSEDEAKKKAEEEKAKADKEKENSAQTVEIDGEVIPVSELVNRYKKLNAKKNAADDEEEEKKKKAEEEAKKNAADEEEKKRKADEEKQNSKYFHELLNARDKAAEVTVAPVVVETTTDKLARGRERY